MQDKAEINALRKHNEEAQTKLKTLAKDHESLKADNESNLAQLNELRDQVLNEAHFVYGQLLTAAE